MLLLAPVTPRVFFFFFFNDTATTEIYTLSLHDALPIWASVVTVLFPSLAYRAASCLSASASLLWHPVTEPSESLTTAQDRKSTRLNSSHGYISYAVFCLKKKQT